MSQSSTQRQFKRFILVGGSTATIDFLVYMYLMYLIPSPYAKGISFAIGTIYAYHTNRLWTFNAGRANLPQAMRFGVVYSTNLGVNVGANAIMLTLLPSNYPWHVGLAFIVATSISAAFNFTGMKWFAFASNRK